MPTRRSSNSALSMKSIQAELRRAEAELALTEVRYTQSVLRSLTEAGGAEVVDDELAGWSVVSSGSKLMSSEKDLQGQGVVTDMATLRRQSYRFWRLNPHARAALRNLQKYIIGREFALDFQDEQRGQWTDRDCSKLRVTNDPGDDLLTRLVWADCVERTEFRARAKELVHRVFRDGEAFLRGSPDGKGRVVLRFIEPARVQNPDGSGRGLTQAGDTVLDWEVAEGQPTQITDGVEHLTDDVESVVAYHVRSSGEKTDRVLARWIVHRKLGDFNDVRGIPFLEPVLKRLANYEQWEHYRLVLNIVRTAVVLVRKIEGGTSSQAASLLAGRQPAPQSPSGRTPQTTSGRREAMFKAGTVLTPGANVDYKFLSPSLEARDAGEDGRRFLLSVAAGVGQPEMLLTGDWSNSNFASSKEAIDSVQREWEDWQDFFAPAFQRIIRWVLSEAERLGLPVDTDRRVNIQWPSIKHEDQEKATNRLATLHSNRVLSRTTWAAQEGLVYDDELENLRAEREAEGGALEDELDLGADEDAVDAAQRVQEVLIALGELNDASAGLATGDEREAVRTLVERISSALLAEGSGRKVQTLIFDKKKFNAAQARQWARKHKFRATKVDTTDGSHRLRQVSPAKFVSDTLRTITLTTGIQAVVGVVQIGGAR